MTDSAEGVHVERRSFLATATAALAGFHVAPRALLPAADERAVDFDEFVARAVPVARELLADTSRVGQDRYLLTLAALAVRLADVARPETMRPSPQGDGVTLGVNPTGVDDCPFVVLHWHLEPGCRVRDHAHTYGNVVTLCLEGEARVRQFEMLGERSCATDTAFRVRQTQDQLLTPGRTNLVSLERDYTHGFTAGPEGARGLDITTRIRERQATPCLELGEAVDAGRRVFEARWVG